MKRSIRIQAIVICIFFNSINIGFARNVITTQERGNDKDIGSRIVGGVDADIREAPYMISVIRNKVHFCGATLISGNIALTAAHCVIRYKPEELSVRAGSSYHAGGGVTLLVLHYVVHEDYLFENVDVAVMILSYDVLAISPVAKLITLTEYEPRDGEIVTAYGWGRLSDHGASPDKLQKVSLPILNRQTCQQYIPNQVITIDMICTYTYKKDACNGDSGGPIIDKNGVQVGITAFGYGCGDYKSPGVFTNIATILPWIREQLSANS